MLCAELLEKLRDPGDTSNGHTKVMQGIAAENYSETSKLVFGTVVRNAPVMDGGEIVLFDWDRKAVLHKQPVYPDNPRMDDDPNPRGNTRGCKGIVVRDGEIIAADFHTLRVYDLSLQHKYNFSHGLMVGLHESFVCASGEIWVSSTVIDAAVKYDVSDKQMVSSIFPRELPKLQKALDLQAAAIDKSADNRRRFLDGDHLAHDSHLHLNAVAEAGGDTFALFHRQGAICNLTQPEVVVRDENLKKAHNLVFADQHTVIVNDTYRQTVRIYDIRTGTETTSIPLTDFEWIREHGRRAARKNAPRKILKKLGLSSESISRPLFVRGLALAGDLLYIGMSPAAIVRINWKSGEFVDAFAYSEDPRTCVHGLALIG